MSGPDSDDAAARADATVATVAPGLASPAVNRRDVVLVTGPWLAGVSAVAAALRERLPRHKFVESADLLAGWETHSAPTAVVFVVSAAAPLTGSDCALLDAVAGNTDAVVGVVSKIDVHRNWREVLGANRDTLAAHAPRYAHVPWVGAAALPDLGDRRVDDLSEAVAALLAEPDLAWRNRLRAWEARLQNVARQYDRDADGPGRRARVEALREERSAALRQRRQAKSERTIALRAQIQQARAQLSHFARNRCSSVRSELQEDAAELSRREMPGFEAYARRRAHEVVAEVGEGTATHLADVAGVLDVPMDLPAPQEQPAVEVAAPPPTSRRHETWLMMLLGAGFGVGVALTLSRLVSGLAPRLGPGLEIAGAAACVAVGLAVTYLVVHLRGLLHDRALLDRWAGDLTSSLRSVAEELVATRVLAAESLLSTALIARDEAENAQVVERVSAIDTDLREHAVAAARAAAVRDREMPAVSAALDVVRAELGEPGIPESGSYDEDAGTDGRPAGGADGNGS